MTFSNKQQLNYLQQQVNQFGPENLSDKEILYFLASYITNQTQAKKWVEQYFMQYSSLDHFRELFREDWELLFENKQVFFEVLEEFAKRYNRSQPLILGNVYSSQGIGQYMIQELGQLQQEVLVCLYLNTKNQILAQKELFKGTLNSATVHPREIFKEALRYSTARFMVIHNHRETRLLVKS